MDLETIDVRQEGAVLFATLSAPPINLMGPDLVRDLALLIQHAEANGSIRVVVFRSADPDFFISHVDVTKIRENREQAAKLTGEASLAHVFHRLSISRLVSIAQIEGRVRGVGSEFILACDMRFAARESAVFGQFESAFGVIPGAGGAQHLARLMGRSRALEVMLGAEDYDADLAERYGWVNRALPAASLGEFVDVLAHRIASFPESGHVTIKDRVNALTLPLSDELRQDSMLFLDGLRSAEVERRIHDAMKLGFQERGVEMMLAQTLGKLNTR